MVKIAVCDDDLESVAFHKDIAKQCLKEAGIGFEIVEYSYSDNLLYDIIQDSFYFDLLLLDIEMPEITGMELAEKIKIALPNIKIIFITSHMEYAIDAFELAIFRYVPKHDIEKRLSAAVVDAAKLIELESDREYIIQTRNRMERIPYKDIFYIQRDGKNASIVTNSGVSKIRKSLGQIYSELETPEFIFIDRGYIVNIIQIMKISEGMAVLKNGEKVPISRSRLQEVKQQINQFWGSHI